MHRAQSRIHASWNPESFQKKQNDYYYKKAKSTAKATINTQAPPKYNHLSHYTGPA